MIRPRGLLDVLVQVDLKGKARMRSPDAPTTSAALQDTSFLTQLHVPAACYQDQASDVSQTSSSGLEQPNVLPLGPAEPWAERCMHVRFQNGDTWDPLKQGEHGAYGGEGDVLGLHYDGMFDWIEINRSYCMNR